MCSHSLPTVTRAFALQREEMPRIMDEALRDISEVTGRHMAADKVEIKNMECMEACYDTVSSLLLACICKYAVYF